MYNSSSEKVIVFIIILLVKKRVYTSTTGLRKNIRKRKAKRPIKKNS